MSHDRGCSCGREKWEYEDCPNVNCYKKDVVMGSIYDCRPENIAAEREYEKHVREQAASWSANKEKKTKKGKLKMSETNDWDFGFTTEDEIKSPEIQSTQDKLLGLRDMILPFLNNLKGNPDMNIIKWDGTKRIAQINSFIDKMNKYIEG